jgi:hypothetical protein
MPSVTIYNKNIPYAFADSVVDAARRQAAGEAITAMASFLAGINAPDLGGVFSLIDSVMFFEDNIQNGPFLMDRSFTDLTTRQFNWKLAEFLDPNHRDCSRASYYYHDAFHISQFAAAGSYPSDIDAQAQWEVDAITAQIGAVKVLGCGDYLVNFLSDFDHSKPQIVARLEAGVAFGHGSGAAALA